MKKKIAIFQSDLTIGGIQKSLLNLLNNLDEKKYEVDLYFLKNGDFSPLVPKWVNVIKLNSWMAKVPFFKITYAFCKRINKEYDLAIDFNGYNAYVSALTLKTKAKKHIIWIHNDLKTKYENEWKYRALYNSNKSKFSMFSTVVCVSKGALYGFSYLTGIEDNCYVIPNYIDVEEIIEKSKENIKYKVDDKKINFVCLGRLCYQKGYDLLLPIIKKLTHERRDFHLYFIGDGEERVDLEEQARNIGIDRYVSFLGAKKNPYAYLNKMDSLLFYSRYEGQGMVLLEAKTLGLEIVMPKHLEKYCDGVSGVDNFLDALVEMKKTKKKINHLDSYNASISKEIKKLLER